jgi:transposase-like protein
MASEASVETYQVKYRRAADCLTKVRAALLVFFDFPAEHWKHLRTANPIESTFATVRHRTSRSKAACRTRRRLPWSSSLSKAHRKIANQSQN